MQKVLISAGSLLFGLVVILFINQSIDSKQTDLVESADSAPSRLNQPSAAAPTEPTADGALSNSSPNNIAKQFLAPIGKADDNTSLQVQQYVQALTAQGFSGTAQGVWMQSDGKLLTNHQGTVPLSAASLTKVATTLASLEVLGVDHRFDTSIGTNGTVNEAGQLVGDLIIQGSTDPFFVWEDAIAIGNLLNQAGIYQVTGDLIVVNSFYMNYQQDAIVSGALLKEGLNADLWTAEASTQYLAMPPGTPRPQLAIVGTVRAQSNTSSNFQKLLVHQSLPLPELLKKMNQYSNNVMAEILAEAVGGAAVVSSVSAQAANVPQKEISLINGSGLGVENRMSPRAVCAMFLTLNSFLQAYDMTISDVFTVATQDEGVLEARALPLSVVKSGSLSQASAIAGALPTENQGIVWFAIINEGENLLGFRKSQEKLLEQLIDNWGTSTGLPTMLKVNPNRASVTAENTLLE